MSTSTCASQITITLVTEGCKTYLKDVTSLVVGNMVSPETGKYWAGPMDKNPWIWTNEGTNANAFALMANYKHEDTETTALSEIVIDPTKLKSGIYEVVLTLHTAEIGPGNFILKAKSATLDGKKDSLGAIKIQEWPKQPDASFYTC